MIVKRYKPKVINSLWDRDNLNAINYNFSAMSDFIAQVEKRIFDYTWEETKEVNTIEMLEPVQTIEDLPENAKPKSLITVIDEQKVYAYVRDEWQLFSEIDLDPFSPFKAELQSMIDTHEKKAEQLLSDMQKEHEDAVSEIKSLTSDFNADYQDKMDELASDYKLKMENLSNDYNTKSSQLQSDYEFYSAQLDTNRTSSLSEISSIKSSSLDEIDKAKQEALDSVTNENQDNWQKYKITDDSGAHQTISLNNDTEKLHALEPGYHYTTSTPIDLPVTSTAGFTTVQTRSDYDNLKHIIFRPYNSTQLFLKRYYNEWLDWEPMDGTKVELFSGSFSDVNKQITLNDDPRRYRYLIVDVNHIGGNDTLFGSFVGNHVVLKAFNLGNSAKGATLIETDLMLDPSKPTVIKAHHSIRVESNTATGKEYMPEIRMIEGVK